MPIPMWVAEVNKRVFNKMELKRGVRPVLTHVGQSSGKTYHTPLDAHEIPGGYIFICNYGANSDWVQNILASGSAHLRVGDDEFDLEHPRLIGEDEAWAQLPATTKRIPKVLNVTDYLQMDIRPA